jgi:type I restriction enzyme R subunit
MQKFPVISQGMTELGGKRFAVIIDEAHSSQSGETSKHVKKALSAGMAVAEDPEEESETLDLEDEIVEEIRLRGRQPHISYFAFTATPKNKTLELFGRKNLDGNYAAFHTYSMRQAIEEGFILDVLKNYTTFARYFKLVKAIEDDRQYERPKAIRALTSYVDLTEHAIDQKTRIMLDHFMQVTEGAIGGRGRGMLVTRSRLHAVRYYLSFREAMKERDLPFKPLVAFSGTVRDPKTLEEHTETSLNRLPPKVDIADALKLPGYRILIVANKYQTGFDEPLLHTMWVDKKLGDVNAVQTLSRLNRTTHGKTDTVVLDFVNEAETIREAFQQYYQTVSLEEETDPNKLYDLQTQLDGFEIYTTQDIEDYAAVFFDEAKPGELLQSVLDRVVAVWRLREEPEREDFRSILQSFVRLYAYVAQLVTFQDVGLEKLYVFARSLSQKLDKREGGGLPTDIVEAVDLDSFRIQETFKGTLDLEKSDSELRGIGAESGGVTEPEMDYLSNIVTNLNETYGLDLDERDRVRLKQIMDDVRNDERVIAVMTGNNSVQNRRRKVEDVVDDHILNFVNTSVELFQKLNEPRASAALKERLFKELQRAFGGII